MYHGGIAPPYRRVFGDSMQAALDTVDGECDRWGQARLISTCFRGCQQNESLANFIDFVVWEVCRP